MPRRPSFTQLLEDPYQLPVSPQEQVDPQATLNRLAGTYEPALTLGTSIAGSTLGGLAGLVDLFRGPEKAAQTVQDVTADLTYQPRTAAGQQGLGDVLGAAESLGQQLEETAPLLTGPGRGDAVIRGGGSPAAATLADVLSPLDALGPLGKAAPAMFLGARAARRAAAAGDDTLQNAFKVAQTLESQGRTPEQIWRATGEHFRRNNFPAAGMVRGVDGEWRFEIPDVNRQVVTDIDPLGNMPEPSRSFAAEQLADNPRYAWELLPGRRDLTLGDILTDSEDLFSLAPELRDYRFRFDNDSGASGYYDPSTGTIAAHPTLISDPKEFRDTVLHETQHALQDMERFSPGASPRGFEPSTEDLTTARYVMNQMADPMRPQIAPQSRQRAAEALRQVEALVKPQGRRAAYRSAPGEVEARLVEDRANMSLPLLQQQFPYDELGRAGTIDTPLAQQQSLGRKPADLANAIAAELLTEDEYGNLVEMLSRGNRLRREDVIGR